MANQQNDKNQKNKTPVQNPQSPKNPTKEDMTHKQGGQVGSTQGPGQQKPKGK